MPASTYRIQLTPDFGFDRAAGLASYLADLGVSHLYASPYLQAAPGSRHGYDVVDHGRPSDDLGGPDGHLRLCQALARAGLGQVLDIVPNHMAIGVPENRWWWDVLENGPSSVFASYFDVDWDPPESKLRNRVLLPILGERYGRAVDAGRIRIEREDGTFTVRYFEHRAPAAPKSLDAVLEGAADRLPAGDEGRGELDELARGYRALPAPTATDRSSVLVRHRDKEILRDRLAALCRSRPTVAGAIDDQLAMVNRDPELLDGLLERQNFRLAYWRTAARELDYRRFFDVSTLAGLRIEDPEVFDATHRLVLAWLDDGVIDGLRIDHPDGLRDPAGYLVRLRQHAPHAWIVLEKILEPGESLPAWPVAGTTGYDFLNLTGGLLVDASAEAAMTETYRAFTGVTSDWGEVAHEAKHLVLRQVLTADLLRLTQQLADVAARHRNARDYTRRELSEALEEILACVAVYRGYVIRPPAEPADAEIITEAVKAGRDRRSDLDGGVFDFLGWLLTAGDGGVAEMDVVLRFQQLSAAVMAKGVEDTAFYRYHRFVALNEVGGDPSRFGITPDEFYGWCRRTHRDWPETMVGLSTHDTKRSEDVRARLAVLSEIPAEWREAVERWAAHNDDKHREGWPDRNTEYLVYQTMVGAWPISVDRLLAYVEKAVRESKTHTSWVDPELHYEHAVASFVRGLFDDREFVESLAAFVGSVARAGRTNSLAQTLLKLTAVGVPDTYQGSELWDLSLVDPDNRRPVDFDLRRRLLDEVGRLSAAAVMNREEQGLPKLWLIARALRLRAERPHCFAPGPHATPTPVPVEGPAAGHVVAYRRDQVAVVVPRLVLALERGGGWGPTRVLLAGGPWEDVLTGRRFPGGPTPVADLVATFPVTLLAERPGS